MEELNGGILQWFPSGINTQLKLGFPTGVGAGSSWNKDFSVRVFNSGTNDVTINNNWDMLFQLTTPNDSSAFSFKVVQVGRQPDGTLRFDGANVVKNNGYTAPQDLQPGGCLTISLDYDQRTIIIQSDALT
tara:strand:+ start:245 stop:637 length:393 start_codon:yes stop_codon:yes gene_type:complete